MDLPSPESRPLPTLLVIEDQETLRANLALLLELEGYRVVTACDGVAGLEVARSERPDLILSDLMMPGLDGRGVVRALRSDSRFDRVPFLFLTARGEKADREEARALGVDGYLTKPVVRDDLLAVVRTRLAEGRSGATVDAIQNEADSEPVSGLQRESLAVLLTGTDILRHHGGALSEGERQAQRAVMLEAMSRLATAMDEGKKAGSADF